MNSLRVWIALLAVVSGLAGFAAGRLTATLQAPQATSAFAEYATRMQATFDLEPERMRALGLLLDRYECDLENLKMRNLNQHQPELVRLGDTYRGWIRDKVLPRERRAEFDSMVAASPDSFID